MPVSRNLIDRADENWRSYETLKETKLNAAASRLYYSIFQLVYAEMLNNGSKNTCEDHEKLGPDDRGVHTKAVEYLWTRDVNIQRKFKELYALRVKADYLETPVSKDELKSCYNYWHSCRGTMISNLNSNAERTIL